MEADKIIRYEKLRGIGVFLTGVATILMAATLMILVVKNHLLVQENRDLDSRLECRANIRDDLDEAIARGLVAVAEDDTEELHQQASLMLDITDRLGEC